MQPALNAARAASARGLPAVALPVARKAVPAQEASPALPDWFADVERASTAQKMPQTETNIVERASSSAAATSATAKGEHYSLYLGADLPMYSTARAEQHLKNMHEPNHRELKIAKYAARLADFLWPGCQENVDEAIAKHKIMVAKNRVHIPEPEYEPPSVPHLLPFTNWLRNSKELRESFVCDANTIYKPRMAWYNPNDGMVPSGWLTEGLLADLAYYKPFTGTRTEKQRW